MGFVEIFLIGVGLSADAFAVSLCKGLKMLKINWRHALVIALFFGGFQALMPLIGFYVGIQFEKLIVSFDHWIAFALLAFIGGRMVAEALKKEDGQSCCEDAGLDLKELTVLAVATSIDALAVGVSFAFVDGVNIFKAISIIGATTFVLSAAGVAIGNRFGARFQKKAELAGGIILILIGVKILAEGLVESAGAL